MENKEPVHNKRKRDLKVIFGFRRKKGIGQKPGTFEQGWGIGRLYLFYRDPPEPPEASTAKTRRAHRERGSGRGGAIKVRRRGARE